LAEVLEMHSTMYTYKTSSTSQIVFEFGHIVLAGQRRIVASAQDRFYNCIGDALVCVCLEWRSACHVSHADSFTRIREAYIILLVQMSATFECCPVVPRSCQAFGRCSRDLLPTSCYLDHLFIVFRFVFFCCLHARSEV
jgi:hypothetical protein